MSQRYNLYLTENSIVKHLVKPICAHNCQKENLHDKLQELRKLTADFLLAQGLYSAQLRPELMLTLTLKPMGHIGSG